MTDLGIYNFIAKSLAEGKSREEITNLLTSGGLLSKQSIDQAFEDVLKNKELGFSSEKPSDNVVRRDISLYIKFVYWMVFLLAIAGCYYAYQRFTKIPSVQLTTKDGVTQLTKGDNVFTVTPSLVFNTDLRIFGYTEKTKNITDFGPISIATHFFLATPLATNQEIFQKQLCERMSFEQASPILVLVLDEGLKRKIRSLESSPSHGGCVRITASTLHVQRFTYKGQVIDVNQINQAGSGMIFDFSKIVLLSSIDEIACN